ncbi:hypothetical protein [uncultured Duncaniella sp.]|uniref:hypothetical protein n=1 Tax=uncultured Duncaniella sp. TaxID=2768039 RepID=UPI00261A7EA2|nr:hypothetical protein [uncultured Duncaniella sp.]
MGTKKPQRKRVPVKQFKGKMIDLSADKTSPAVRRLVRLVETSFRGQVKIANIPALNVLYPTLTVQSFFMNHTDYEAILGTNVDLLDRMMLTAISDTLARDIEESITEAGVHYVGVWDLHTLYSVVSATVTFMNNDTTVDKYLTPLQYKTIDAENLTKLPEGSYMPFTDYNPNRFYQQIVGIRQVVLSTISGMMEKRIPKAFLSSADYSLSHRMLDYYYNGMHEGICKMIGEDPETHMLNAYGEEPANEKLVREFTDAFEKPFLEMLVAMLAESGLSTNVINLMLGSSRVHIMYDDPDGKQIKDVTITYILSTEKSGLPKATKVEYKTTIGDAAIIATIKPAMLPKSRRDQYGKPIRSFLLDLCTYAINIYCDVAGSDNAVNINNTDSTAKPDVEDMDEGQLSELLAGVGGGTVETEEVK